jgi:acyl-CoA synthetase (AMP-forming)/AMP-acid ligase II
VASWESVEQSVPDVEIHPEDVATIFFTSGTTGLPKGVVGSNRNYTTNLLNSLISQFYSERLTFRRLAIPDLGILADGNRAYLRRGEDMPTPDPNIPQKAMLLAVPLFHAVGNHSSLGLCTMLGFRVSIYSVLLYHDTSRQLLTFPSIPLSLTDRPHPPLGHRQSRPSRHRREDLSRGRNPLHGDGASRSR